MFFEEQLGGQMEMQLPLEWQQEDDNSCGVKGLSQYRPNLLFSDFPLRKKKKIPATARGWASQNQKPKWDLDLRPRG